MSTPGVHRISISETRSTGRPIFDMPKIESANYAAPGPATRHPDLGRRAPDAVVQVATVDLGLAQQKHSHTQTMPHRASDATSLGSRRGPAASTASAPRRLEFAKQAGALLIAGRSAGRSAGGGGWRAAASVAASSVVQRHRVDNRDGAHLHDVRARALRTRRAAATPPLDAPHSSRAT